MITCINHRINNFLKSCILLKSLTSLRQKMDCQYALYLVLKKNCPSILMDGMLTKKLL